MKAKVKVLVSVSIQLFLTPWTVARQAPLSTEISGQEYQSALPFLSPEDCLNPGIKPASLASPALAGVFFTTEPPGKAETCEKRL